MYLCTYTFVLYVRMCTDVGVYEMNHMNECVLECTCEFSAFSYLHRYALLTGRSLAEVA